MKLGKKLLAGIFTGIWLLAIGGISMATSITNVIELQNMNNDLAGHYVLDNDIDASATSNWNGGAGFIPIGTWAAPFTGSFDGQGHKITNLFINRPTTRRIGLFGCASATSNIHDVTLENCDITGGDFNVGTLVGENLGLVSNCHATGNVRGNGNTVGGFIGDTWTAGAQVSNSHAEVTVTIPDRSQTIQSIGGFIGSSSTGNLITNCYAMGDIIIGSTLTAADDIQYIGGFIGLNYAVLTNCWATGDITIGNCSDDFYDIGGLVGWNTPGGDMTDCYALGNITLGNAVDRIEDIGGLVGDNGAIVSRCCAAGSIQTGDAGSNISGVGGLCGISHDTGGSIANSHALGNITVGNAATWIQNIGGLAGYQQATAGLEEISNCYAKGNIVVGNAVANFIRNIGGLVGLNWDTISKCYSRGSITTGTAPAISDIGGLVGDNSGVVNTSFWDTETSGQAISDGGVGKTTEEMKTKSTFTDAGWDFDTIWSIYELPVYEPSYLWLQADGRCQCEDAQPHPKQIFEPHDLLCEQKKNPVDVFDEYPEFSAIHGGFGS